MSNEQMHVSIIEEDERVTVILNPRSYKGLVVKLPKGGNVDEAIESLNKIIHDTVMGAVANKEQKIREALTK